MHKSHSDLINSLHESRQTMIAQLHQFCEINSASINIMGLNTMRQTLNSAFIPLADKIETINFPPVPYIGMDGETTMTMCGDALFISKRPENPNRILLCGHMDTVYDLKDPFQKLTFLDENHLNGPGVADMKGGIIVILHALLAFERTPFSKNIGWDVFISGDEEIGSPASSKYLAKIGQQYKVALVYEPAMDLHGTFARNRKGSGKMALIASGKASHAGRSFHLGRNAITYLAEVITEINKLNNLRPGVTINAGLIHGGTALNVVAEKAVVKFDIRISEKTDEAWFREEMNKILNKFKRNEYSLIAHIDFLRPVKKINKETDILFNQLKKIGDELNINIDWRDSGGCCDGNNLSQFNLGVIDTLGVVGDNIHSSEEFIVLDSLVERSILSSLLLVELAQGDFAT